MEYQLRVYEVNDGQMETFLDIFPEVVAARRSAGFEVMGAWMVPESNGFVWIVGSEEGIARAEETYYASAQRRAIEPEPAKLLSKIDTRTMIAVDY